MDMYEGHQDYYTNMQLAGWGVALIAMIFGLCVCCNSKGSENMDRKISFILTLACFFQIGISWNPSGMKENIGTDYKTNIAFMWAMSCLACNAQLGCLSGYVSILSAINPKEKEFRDKIVNATEYLFYLKVLADILGCAILYLNPELMSQCFVLEGLLSLVVYIGHPLVCSHYASKVAAATKATANGQVSSGSAKAKQREDAQKRVSGFVWNLRIVAAFNVAATLFLVAYCKSNTINLEAYTSSATFDQYAPFFYMIDFIYPLIQLMVIIVVLLVFHSGSQVAKSEEFHGAVIGVLAVIALLYACAVDDDMLDDMDDIEAEDDQI